MTYFILYVAAIIAVVLFLFLRPKGVIWRVRIKTFQNDIIDIVNFIYTQSIARPDGLGVKGLAGCVLRFRFCFSPNGSKIFNFV